MKKLFLALAFVGFIASSGIAYAIIKSNAPVTLCDDKKCDNKKCKDNKKKCKKASKKECTKKSKKCCAKKAKSSEKSDNTDK